MLRRGGGYSLFLLTFVQNQFKTATQHRIIKLAIKGQNLFLGYADQLAYVENMVFRTLRRSRMDLSLCKYIEAL
ncbi:hypothetical protein VCR14J2_270059 [Vibrio coralliirubri]|nr:hypothetical protein VCR14J2_270059 [Vibrio coralliirubri]